MISAKQIIPHNALQHHSILGMKWGKKNGPPYPIGASDHSASEKKAGWRRSLDKSDSGGQNDNKKHGLTDKQKKAIKIGIAVTATALATYGTYRLAKSGKLDKYVEAGKAKVDEMFGKKGGNSDFGKTKVSDIHEYAFTQKKATAKTVQTVNGIKKLAKAENISDVIKNANPHIGDTTYKNNCSACGIASFLRSQGYDVTAKSTGGKPQEENHRRKTTDSLGCDRGMF